jgi:hypothetical protein
VEVFDVPFFGMTGDFVQPSDRVGFQAGFRWVIFWIDDLNFNFHGILAALDPSLSFFASFTH